jgi:RHS repeat-associated protein
VTWAGAIAGGYQTGLGRGKLTSTAVENRSGYGGYERDRGLLGSKQVIRHRILDLESGRWISRDPAEYLDWANLFQYARSSPLTSLDPMGLASLSTIWRPCGASTCQEGRVTSSFWQGADGLEGPPGELEVINTCTHTPEGDAACFESMLGTMAEMRQDCLTRSCPYISCLGVTLDPSCRCHLLGDPTTMQPCVFPFLRKFKWPAFGTSMPNDCCTFTSASSLKYVVKVSCRQGGCFRESIVLDPGVAAIEEAAAIDSPK